MTTDQRSWRLPALLLFVSTTINALQLLSPEIGDLSLYREIGERALKGIPLYGEHPFEYPPYVVPWWLLPALRTLQTGRESAFIKPFGAELLLIDTTIKWLLLVEGRKRWKGVRAYLPFALVAVMGIAYLHIYFRRFDLIPAGMSIFSLVALSSGWPLVSGLLLSAAVGTKLYPAVIVPFCFVVAWQRGELKRWMAGSALGLAPLVPLGFAMPWWRFTNAHQTRGLQVESLYAGVIWLRHRLGGPGIWVRTPEGSNVGGELAWTILPFTKALWVTAILVSVGVSSWAARRPSDLLRLANLSLIPLTAFIAFNFVLSPQYLIWIAGLVALAAVAHWSWPLILLAIAVLLGPFIYPTPSYEWGYDLPHVIILCVRNCLLAVAWVGLVLDVLRQPRETAVTS